MSLMSELAGSQIVSLFGLLMLSCQLYFCASKLTNPISGNSTIYCVGDSITYGVGATNRTYHSYPGILRAYLSYSSIPKPLVLKNFGVPNKSLALNVSNSFWKTYAYSMVSKGSPSTILLGFGFDSYRFNWNASTFVRDYKVLIRNFLKLPSKPKIYLLIPPPLYVEVEPRRYSEVPLAVKSICKSYAANITGCIDLHHLLGTSGLYKSYLFTQVSKDSKSVISIYPNDFGYMEIAHLVAEQIIGESQAMKIRSKVRQLPQFEEIFRRLLERIKNSDIDTDSSFEQPNSKANELPASNAAQPTKGSVVGRHSHNRRNRVHKEPAVSDQLFESDVADNSVMKSIKVHNHTKLRHLIENRAALQSHPAKALKSSPIVNSSSDPSLILKVSLPAAAVAAAEAPTKVPTQSTASVIATAYSAGQRLLAVLGGMLILVMSIVPCRYVASKNHSG